MNNLNNLVSKISNSNVYNIVKKTPYHQLPKLTNKYNNNIWAKREDLLKPVYSFKLRGAYNSLSNYPTKSLVNGIVACSAGNHAQGVAYSAKVLGVHSTIFMPVTTPDIKINAVKDLGAKVILKGDNYNEAQYWTEEYKLKNNCIMIHPFNSDYTIAGQGTVAKEILEQHNKMLYGPIDYIFCPVGGGGLISGIGAWIKYFSKNTKIIGVEEYGSNAMTKSLQKNKLIELPFVNNFTDGTAVTKVGDNTFEYCKIVINDMVQVSVDDVCFSIKEMFNETRSLMEPAGALALAGAIKFTKTHNITNKNIVSVFSGANIDFSNLSGVVQRSNPEENLLAIKIPEKNGSFVKLYNDMTKANKNKQINITEFSYRYNNTNTANIFYSIELSGHELSNLTWHLKNNGYTLNCLEDDEVSKIHARYLVGKTNTNLKERIIRFTFPDRVGALGCFLNKLNINWNISLFHYKKRNSYDNSVLIGIQVPNNDDREFNRFLKNLGYYYQEETNNPVFTKYGI